MSKSAKGPQTIDGDLMSVSPSRKLKGAERRNVKRWLKSLEAELVSTFSERDLLQAATVMADRDWETAPYGGRVRFRPFEELATK